MSFDDIFSPTLTRGFRSTLTMTSFCPTLVRVFVANIGKVFFGNASY